MLHVLPVTVEDVAQVLQVPPGAIERNSLQRWPHMLRVRLTNGQFHCVSYRALPGWAIAGEAALSRCTTLAQLDEFAHLVGAEAQRFQNRYPEATLERWQQVWEQKRQQVLAADMVRQQEQERQQAGIDWKASWYLISRYCRDRNSFAALWQEWQRQCGEFAHLPQIVQEIKFLLQQRWQELSHAS